MATITKRKNSDRSISYVAQVRVRPFKPVAKSFADRKQAEAWASGLEGELQAEKRGGAAHADLGRMTLRDLVHEYVNDDAAQSLTTYKGRQDHLATWVNSHGNVRIREISVLVLREARDRLRPGRTPATVNRYLAAMRACWNWGRAAGLVPQDRAWPTKLMLREPSDRVRFLSDDELDTLLQAARDESPVVYAAVVVSLATGLRRGELLRLTWNDVDFDRSRLQVLIAKNKTRRSVHLPAQAVAVLKTLRQLPVVGQRVLLNPEGQPMNGNQLHTHWKHIRKAAKLRDFRWHDLRHTCASFLAQNGANLLEIGAVLGHKSPSVTRRYAHLVEGAPVTGHTELDSKLRGAS